MGKVTVKISYDCCSDGEGFIIKPIVSFKLPNLDHTTEISLPVWMATKKDHNFGCVNGSTFTVCGSGREFNCGLCPGTDRPCGFEMKIFELTQRSIENSIVNRFKEAGLKVRLTKNGSYNTILATY